MAGQDNYKEARMKIAVIGNGAIAKYAMQELTRRGHEVVAQVLRQERIEALSIATAPDHPRKVSSIKDLPPDTEHVIDCAGHHALALHGPPTLRSGLNLTTLSLGALAEADLYDVLKKSAIEGGSRLYLASGAIGSLDCLRAASIGHLDAVKYIGRKPPEGWLGSAAEKEIDLAEMKGKPQTHFHGSARVAAIRYPKNANVAAAVALAGLGFDETEVELIADPTITTNIHEIHAEGDFGTLTFQISGTALPENPRSSALAAMSAVSTFERANSLIVI